MAAFVISLAKGVVFVLLAASAILSLYAATHAMAVYTDVDVFLSGLAMILVGVALGPLFCFIAAYGLVNFLDLPTWEAVVLVAPALAGWCVAAARALGGAVAR